MSDFESLVNKAARAMAEWVPRIVNWNNASAETRSAWVKNAAAALEAAGLPALLERVEAGAVFHCQTHMCGSCGGCKAAGIRWEVDELRDERDALAAKVADAGERIALAIEAERDNTDRPDMFESGHWNGLDAAAAIARTALTEGTEGA